MLRMGLATVYEAKSGAEYGEFEAKYREAERRAKMKRRGLWGGKKRQGLWARLWGGKKADFESPRDFKSRMKQIQ